MIPEHRRTRHPGFLAALLILVLPAGCGHMAQFGETGPRAYIHGHIDTFEDRPVTGLSLHLLTGAATRSKPKEIVLLHGAGPFASGAREQDSVEAAIDELRKRRNNVFLLSAGGVPRERIETLNRRGHNLMTPSAHDLADAPGELRQAAFPLLGANLALPPDAAPPIDPYAILKTPEGYTIAVLGLTAPDPGAEAVKIAAPIATARAFSHLAEEHHVFVALTNLDPHASAHLAEAAPALDVIFAHSAAGATPSAKTVNGVFVAYINPAAEPAQPPGKVTLTMKNGKLIDKTAEYDWFTRP